MNDIPEYKMGDIPEHEWMHWIADNWADDLADPRQDIYSLTDGTPIDSDITAPRS